MLMPVLDKPLVICELDRIRRSKLINELWLATSEDPADDVLAEEVEKRGYRVFRGSEDDVLDRYYTLARQRKAEVVVRLTGDCPLHDPDVIDFVIRSYQNAEPMVHYACNTQPPTFPHGLDVEVFSFSALQEAANTCVQPVEREHVTPGIHGQFRPKKPRILNVTAPADFSNLRWTLDYREDYEVIRAVFEALYPVNPDFTWLDVVAFMTRKPDLIVHNKRSERNETFLVQLPAYIAELEKNAKG